MSDILMKGTEPIGQVADLTADNVEYSSGVSVKEKIDNLIKHDTLTGTTNANGLLSSNMNRKIISATCSVSSHCITLFDWYGTSDFAVFKVLDGTNMNPITNTSVSIEYWYIDV